MDLVHIINVIVTDSLPHIYLIPLAIIIGTFILEDATTVIVGIFAADGLIGIPIAIISLYAGIILGDFWLYGMGYLAANHRWAQWFINHERYEPIRSWLEERFESAVFTSRFVPGLRLPTYTAAGFLKLPFRRFVPPVIFGTLIWTSGFFASAYIFGNVTASTLGIWRWPIAVAVILAWLAFNRWRIKHRKQAQATQAKTASAPMQPDASAGQGSERAPQRPDVLA